MLGKDFYQFIDPLLKFVLLLIFRNHAN
jgi:hypothetical protein